MIDIETLGTKPDCVVLSIGAVLFDLNQKRIGEARLWPLNVKSQVQEGRKIDIDTVMWWLKQAPEASDHFSQDIALNVTESVLDFKAFIKDCTFFWAKSPSFDMVILSDLIAGKTPWTHRNQFDVRTAIEFGNKAAAEKVYNEWIGTAHDPINDCKLQIEQLFAALKS